MVERGIVVHQFESALVRDGRGSKGAVCTKVRLPQMGMLVVHPACTHWGVLRLESKQRACVLDAKTRAIRAISGK